MLPPGEGKTVSFSGNRVTLIHGHPGLAYSVVEWASGPGIPGPPLHIHTMTDEAFYVVDGTFGFLAGERTFEGGAGAFVFVPKGLEHTYWNEAKTSSKMLITISPPGFEGYFKELADLSVHLSRRRKVRCGLLPRGARVAGGPGEEHGAPRAVPQTRRAPLAHVLQHNAALLKRALEGDLALALDEGVPRRRGWDEGPRRWPRSRCASGWTTGGCGCAPRRARASYATTCPRTCGGPNGSGSY